MLSTTDIEALVALADPACREAAADRVAKLLQAQTLIIFVNDPALNVLLPAPGFLQTLPSRVWRPFLARAAQSDTSDTLPFPDRTAMQPVCALRTDDGTVLVLVGAAAPAAADLDKIRALLPLLGAVYKSELQAQTAQEKVVLITESVAQANALTQRLDRARSDLERTLRALRTTEEALAKEKEQLAVTLQSIGDGVITCDLDGRVVLMNTVAQDLTGWPLDAARARPLEEIFKIVDEQSRAPQENPVKKVLQTGNVVELANHTALIARDATERSIADSGAPIRDRNGNVLGVVLVFRDITGKRKLEEELTKAQRLESIGLLAAGIAHDFNNILTALFGNIALAKMRAQVAPDVIEVLDEAEGAFHRARDLTYQLLTFAKGGAPIRKAASLATLITDSAAFVLQRANIYCQYDFDPELALVLFDRGQMSQAINHLLINAREAMPGGGKIIISAKNVTLDEGSVGTLKAGRYVHVTIADEGSGIPARMLHKIFDPYFSTKERGSGLGLATTYSIIKRHDGYIAAESQVNVGTVFHIYLPSVASAS